MPTLLTPTRREATIPQPPAIDDITRRDLLRGAGVLGAGWILVGCGADRAAGPATTTASRRYSDDTGRTAQIPERQRRIVALSDGAVADPLLELVGAQQDLAVLQRRYQERVAAVPVFRELAAVRAGQAHQWGDDWRGRTYRALHTVLDDLEVRLPAAAPELVS